MIISRESTDSVEHGTDSNRVLKLQDNKTKYKILLLAITVHDCSLWTKRIHTAKETYTKVTSLVQRKRKTRKYFFCLIKYCLALFFCKRKCFCVGCFMHTEAISGTTCGRLLVHVQKGKRFISLGMLYEIIIICMHFISVYNVSKYWIYVTILTGNEIKRINKLTLKKKRTLGKLINVKCVK